MSETMRAVAAMGFTPLAVPMLRIEPLSPVVPRRVQAVLLTSGQAAGPLAAWAPWLRDVPVLAVGAATAARAGGAGFRRVRSGDADAERLAELAALELDPLGGAVLLACGTGQGAGLAAGLRGRGFAVVRRCVYRARSAARFEPEGIAALDRGDVAAALFFSAETARSFAQLLPRGLHRTLNEVRALAIGARAAARLERLPWKQIAVAAEPNAATLLSLLRQSDAQALPAG